MNDFFVVQFFDFEKRVLAETIVNKLANQEALSEAEISELKADWSINRGSISLIFDVVKAVERSHPGKVENDSGWCSGVLRRVRVA